MTTNSDRRQGELDRRERAVAARESAASDREELDRLRGEALRAREELEQARAERERLAREVRDVNESLVLALTHSYEMAEAADTARAVLAASEERFRSRVTTSAAIVFHADALGRVRVDAERWRGYTGLDPHEPGDGWLEAVHPLDQSATRAAWAEATERGTVFTHQHRLQRTDGTHAWVVTRAVPVPTDGPIREWIGMMTDVSDRVRLEEAREQFMAILGHDLRNPLNVVTLATQILKRSGPTAAQLHNIVQILRSTRRMDGMILDLLDFARGHLGGGIPVTRAPVDLRRNGDEAVSAVRLAQPDRTIEYEAVGDLTGEWDSARLDQVLANLIDNAVLHGSDPIRLTLSDEGTEAVTRVHSFGAPIPTALLPGIFEPFHGRPRSRTEGLGLGMYIVHEIVRAHGGSVSVRSSEEEGTTFTARWPKRPPTA